MLALMILFSKAIEEACFTFALDNCFSPYFLSMKRIAAKDALDAEYFWTDPLPCDPKRFDLPNFFFLVFYLYTFYISMCLLHLYLAFAQIVNLSISLPKYEASHEFQTKKKRQQQRQHEENSKRQKIQHNQQHSRLPPIQQSGHAHAQMRTGPNQPAHGGQPQVAGVPGHHYGKPRPSAGAGRYPPGGNPSGGYNNPNRGQGGGGYGSGPYPPQGRAPPYGSSMPAAGPRGGGGSGYGSGGPNYPHGGPYGTSGAGRGSNMMSGNRNQHFNWQQ